MVHEKPPGYVRAVAIALLSCGALAIFGVPIQLFQGDLSWSDWGAVGLAVVIFFTGLWLFKGIVWGYLLALALAVYMLGCAAYLLLFSRDNYSWAAWVGVRLFLIPGCIVLVVLVTPRTLRWFRGAWRARVDLAASGSPPLG